MVLPMMLTSCSSPQVSVSNDFVCSVFSPVYIKDTSRLEALEKAKIAKNNFNWEKICTVPSHI